MNLATTLPPPPAPIQPVIPINPGMPEQPQLGPLPSPGGPPMQGNPGEMSKLICYEQINTKLNYSPRHSPASS